MTQDERRRHAVRLLLNRVLPRYQRGFEYKAVVHLETFLQSPAFDMEDHQALIDDAYAIHHLPHPSDYDAWERRRQAAGAPT